MIKGIILLGAAALAFAACGVDTLPTVPTFTPGTPRNPPTRNTELNTTPTPTLDYIPYPTPTFIYTHAPTPIPKYTYDGGWQYYDGEYHYCGLVNPTTVPVNELRKLEDIYDYDGVWSYCHGEYFYDYVAPTPIPMEELGTLDDPYGMLSNLTEHISWAMVDYGIEYIDVKANENAGETVEIYADTRYRIKRRGQEPQIIEGYEGMEKWFSGFLNQQYGLDVDDVSVKLYLLINNDAIPPLYPHWQSKPSKSIECKDGDNAEGCTFFVAIERRNDSTRVR